MKTCKDLKFEAHPISKSGRSVFNRAKQAVEQFENGYGISVLLGNCFYSNGINTYEIAVLFNGDIEYNTDITDSIIGYLSEDEVTEYMLKIQILK